MATKNQEELLVRYPSPYKVVDGNLCMEVTEKHSKYDKKLANLLRTSKASWQLMMERRKQRFCV